MKRLTLPISVAILFLCPNIALGCSCASTWLETPKDTEEQFRSKVEGALKNAAFVFTAEVIEFEKPDPSVANTENPFEELTKLKIKFKIEKVWKGELPDEIIMPARSGKFGNGDAWQTGCAYIFEEGKKYLVYADDSKDKPHVHICSRTKLLDAAEREIEVLDGLKRGEEKPQALIMFAPFLSWRNLTTACTRPPTRRLSNSNKGSGGRVMRGVRCFTSL